MRFNTDYVENNFISNSESSFIWTENIYELLSTKISKLFAQRFMSTLNEIYAINRFNKSIFTGMIYYFWTPLWQTGKNCSQVL